MSDFQIMCLGFVFVVTAALCLQVFANIANMLWEKSAKPKMRETKLLMLQIIREYDGEADGLLIAEEIEKRTGKRISTGAMYVWLYEMTEDGLIQSEMRKGGAERGYLDRQFYRLAGHGLAELKGLNEV